MFISSETAISAVCRTIDEGDPDPNPRSDPQEVSANNNNGDEEKLETPIFEELHVNCSQDVVRDCFCKELCFSARSNFGDAKYAAKQSFNAVMFLCY